jgi:hypothetical protein
VSEALSPAASLAVTVRGVGPVGVGGAVPAEGASLFYGLWGVFVARLPCGCAGRLWATMRLSTGQGRIWMPRSSPTRAVYRHLPVDRGPSRRLRSATVWLLVAEGVLPAGGLPVVLDGVESCPGSWPARYRVMAATE